MSAEQKDGRTSIALVLGSGGARGLAHIGVIERLLESDYRIDYISGCSMGALVGGIYAAGKMDVYKEWARGLERRDVLSLLDIAIGRAGLLKGEKVIGVLTELIGDHRIEDLPIGYTAVATDLLEQKEVWLNRGRLFDAIRASIAIPTVFTPHRIRGRLLVDGGLLNPIPIAPALNHETDLIVAVNLNAARTERRRGGPRLEEAKEGDGKGEIPGIFDIMSLSMDTMQNAIARLKLAGYSPDLVVDVPRDACSFYEFYRADELIALGRECASRALARLEGKKNGDA
jgi:NTE family protein